MTHTLTKTYPGEAAAPMEVRKLADEFREAALLLLPQGRRGQPLSRAPFRLTAIHAVELYLTALLRHHGHDASQIRGLQHDLAARTDLALGHGLKLRQRTAAHLRVLSQTREYLSARYGPETTGTASQVNRLAATLDEVAQKVTVAMGSVQRGPAGVSAPDGEDGLRGRPVST
jgi:HEPN domain-containing protein